MLYAWVCFRCCVHDICSRVYHTWGVRTTLDDLTSYVSDDSTWCKSFSLYGLTVVFKLLIDNLFSVMCNFLFLHICRRLIWKNLCVHQHELFRIENLFKLKEDSMKLSMSCEQQRRFVFYWLTIKNTWTVLTTTLAHQHNHYAGRYSQVVEQKWYGRKNSMITWLNVKPSIAAVLLYWLSIIKNKNDGLLSPNHSFRSEKTSLCSQASIHT